MSFRLGVFLGTIGWVVVVSLLHGWLNLGLFDRAPRRGPTDLAPFRVGFIPVT